MLTVREERSARASKKREKRLALRALLFVSFPSEIDELAFAELGADELAGFARLRVEDLFLLAAARLRLRARGFCGRCHSGMRDGSGPVRRE